MPEFEENLDASKNAPYTYEPSKASAAELGELAGVVITPGASSSSTRTPTKSRWGKSQDQESQGGTEKDVPAGEIDLSNVEGLTDDPMKNRGGSNRPSRTHSDDREEESSRKRSHQRPSDDERSDRRQGGERSRGRSSDREGSERRDGGERTGDRRQSRGRSSDREDSERRGGGERTEDRSRSRNPRGGPQKREETQANPSPVQDESETFSDKIVNFVKKLFNGGPSASESQNKNRSKRSSGESRQRSGDRRRSSGERRRNRPAGEGNKRSGERTSSGRRRRRRSGGGSRPGNPSA